MSNVERILFLSMLLIICGILIIIFFLGASRSGKERITQRLLSAKGDVDRKRRGYRFAKRLFDVFVSLVALIITSPMILIISILLKTSGTKPLFVRYNCVGRGGREAHYSKFNTIDQDSRFTQFLRGTRLDAFPMYWDVLRCDLTLIGISLIRYDTASEERKLMYRYEKPGLVSIGRLFKIDGKTEEEVDRLYLKTRSMVLDVSILFYLMRQVLVTPVE